jgi:hypothetical protein
MRLIRLCIVAGFIVPVTFAAPVAGHAPLSFAEEATSVGCESVASESGTVRLTASVSTLSGPAGP